MGYETDTANRFRGVCHVVDAELLSQAIRSNEVYIQRIKEKAIVQLKWPDPELERELSESQGVDSSKLGLKAKEVQGGWFFPVAAGVVKQPEEDNETFGRLVR